MYPPPFPCPCGLTLDHLGLWRSHVQAVVGLHKLYLVMTWSSQFLDSLRNFQNFAVFSLWKNPKTFEIRATWPPSLAGPGMFLLPAWNHLLGAPNLTLPQFIFQFFFLLGEIFSIINHVILVLPEPFLWKGDPELVFGPGLSSEAPDSHVREWRSRPESGKPKRHICFD